MVISTDEKKPLEKIQENSSLAYLLIFLFFFSKPSLNPLPNPQMFQASKGLGKSS